MVQLIVVLVLVETLFYTFGMGLELSSALGVLIALIGFQIHLLMKRIRVRRQLSDPAASRAASVLKTLKVTSKTGPANQKTDNKIDSSVFSEFQKNVERADKNITSTKDSEKEQEVIVSLSSKAPATKPSKEQAVKQPAAVAQVKQAPQKTITPSSRESQEADLETTKNLTKNVRVDPIGSLFDDVQESLETEPTIAEANLPETAVPESDLRSPDQPILSNEFLTGKDLSMGDDSAAEGIELALKVAGDQFDRGKFDDSLATIRQFLNDGNKKSAASEQMRKLVELKGENEFELEQYDRSSHTLQAVFSKFISKSSPDFLPMLEKYIGKFIEPEQHKHAIHFMFTALNEYRQLHDHAKMDQIYNEIEHAYRQIQDWPRLIQTLQNHLTIKKVLKDYNGQLDLLDHLGKLLYDQGEKEKSKKCYEQRLVVEADMAKASK